MIYHLEIEARFCKVDAILNGFPISSINGFKPAIFSKQINSALVGKNNKLEFIIIPEHPLDPDAEYNMQGSVKIYSNNQMTGPDQGKKVISFSQEKKPALNISFDNDEFDFSYPILDGEQFDDTELLKDYGLKLKDLLLKKDINPIINEFAPKLIDFSICYSVDVSDLVAQFRDYLQNNYFGNVPILDFTREQIMARPWCGERIWELGVGVDFKELILTEPNDESIQFSTKIYVAKIKGNLKVVR